MQQELKERDIRFDVLKGIATIVVVLGHVLQYCTKGYEDTFVYGCFGLLFCFKKRIDI